MKRLAYILVLLFFLTACAFSDSVIQKVTALAQTATPTLMDTHTPYPSPEVTATETSPGEYALTPEPTEDFTPGMEEPTTEAGKGTGEPGGEEVSGTSTPQRVPTQKQESAVSVEGKPVGYDTETGLVFVAIVFMLVLFSSLSKEKQGPKK